MNSTKSEGEKNQNSPKKLDDLLKKMLSTPPKPHPKPAKKDAEKKTAE